MHDALVRGFTDSCQNVPHKPAFIIGDEVYTYGMLASGIAQLETELADGLNQAGVGVDSDFKGKALCIAVSLGNCVDLALWYLLSVKQGQLFVLLDPSWSDLERDYALSLVKPDVLVSADGQEKSAIRFFVNSPTEHAVISSHQLFFAGFTSGSSGRPKAFARTAKSWITSFESSAVEFGTSSDSVIVAPGPLSHGLGFFAMAESFYHGATFVSQRVFSATSCLQILQTGRYSQSRSSQTIAVSMMVLVPSMLHAILESADANKESPTHYDNAQALQIVTAGAKLVSRVRQRCATHFPDISLSEYYGASELSFVSVAAGLEPVPERSVGRAFTNVRVSIGEADEVGDEGLIQVSSDLLASGYLQRSEEGLILSPLAESAWATVGDRGYLDESGYLYLLDRDDRMMNSGGLKVYPSVVERAAADYFVAIENTGTEHDDDRLGDHLDDHLGNRQGYPNCVVVGLPDDYWGDRVGLVVAGAGWTCSHVQEHKHALLEFCRSRLQRHELPKQVFYCERLPMTSSGKISYRELQLALIESQGAEGDYCREV